MHEPARAPFMVGGELGPWCYSRRGDLARTLLESRSVGIAPASLPGSLGR